MADNQVPNVEIDHNQIDANKQSEQDRKLPDKFND